MCMYNHKIKKNMKKAYIIPSIVNVNIRMESLLQTLSGQQGNNAVTTGFSNDEYDGESAANGSGGFWDDED